LRFCNDIGSVYTSKILQAVSSTQCAFQVTSCAVTAEEMPQHLRDISITNSVPCLFTSPYHTSVLKVKGHTLIKKSSSVWQFSNSSSRQYGLWW